MSDNAVPAYAPETENSLPGYVPDAPVEGVGSAVAPEQNIAAVTTTPPDQFRSSKVNFLRAYVIKLLRVDISSTSFAVLESLVATTRCQTWVWQLRIPALIVEINCTVLYTLNPKSLGINMAKFNLSLEICTSGKNQY
jgi:hypothetical protein